MAKKSRGFSELVRQHKEENQSNKLLDKIETSIKRDFGANVVTVKNPSGVAKMSDILKDFVSPYEDVPQNRKELQHFLETAVTAWNLALLPKKERIKILDKIFIPMLKKAKTVIDKEDIAYGRFLIEELIDRKLKYFADNQRKVMSFQIENFGKDGYYLSVASTIPQ